MNKKTALELHLECLLTIRNDIEHQMLHADPGNVTFATSFTAQQLAYHRGLEDALHTIDSRLYELDCMLDGRLSC